MAAFTANVQVPRWIRATFGPVSDAGKSPISQPEVELVAGVGGITMSLVGTNAPVTSPLPEYASVLVT